MTLRTGTPCPSFCHPRRGPAVPRLPKNRLPKNRVPHLHAQFHRALRWVPAPNSLPIRNCLLATIALLPVLAIQAHAQGCAQCLDSTRATPPEVQAAYRHAILLLIGFGVSLFIAGTLLLREKR